MATVATLPMLAMLLRRVRDWPEESQLQARRNAMVAATALARRRAEQAEVEEFLAALTRTSVAATPAQRAARG